MNVDVEIEKLVLYKKLRFFLFLITNPFSIRIFFIDDRLILFLLSMFINNIFR